MLVRRMPLRRGAFMCHLLLVLPIVALAVFWILPLAVALPIYIVVSGWAVIQYILIMKSMAKPAETGVEELLQKTGRVMEVRSGEVVVRVHGEIWKAVSPEALHEGDPVKIVGVNGLTLEVRKAN